MENPDVFEALRATIAEILPGVAAGAVKAGDSLRDLGANSVDRVDIISETLEAYDLRVSMIEFGELHTVQEIVDVIEKHRAAAAR
jgi:polyketide biosynthesis acyl carrier protein